MKNSKAIALKEQIKRSNIKFATGYIVFLAIAVICASVFFILYSAKYDQISRDDALVFSGGFESYKESNSSKDDSVLYFNDGNYFYISLACESKEFIKSIEVLEQGTLLDILVNPNNNCIIEI